jgi:hypothetical protein
MNEQPLPALLDCKQLQRELNITRAAAEAIMRKLPAVIFEDLRKTYVKREDVTTYLEACTSGGEWVFRKERIAA